MDPAAGAPLAAAAPPRLPVGTRRLPALHLEGEGGAGGTGLLRGDPRRAAGLSTGLALPSGRRVPPPTCRRVTLYSVPAEPPSGRLAAGFGPFTPPYCQ